MIITQSEKNQLAAALGCPLDKIDTELQSYSAAATEEYVRMILGQQAFSRGQDIREYRIYLLIVHVFRHLPSEKQVSTLFQTTIPQSRSLLRGVMAKYHYELQGITKETLRDAIRNAQEYPGDNKRYLLKSNSIAVIDALNREIESIEDGTLTQVSKSRGTAAYEIGAVAYKKLLALFP